MKMSAIVLGVVIILTGLPLAVHAQAVAVEQAQKPVLVGNKICPVSGEKISADSGMSPVTYEYKGKVYNLCCPGCIGKFQEDSEKYSQVANEEVVNRKEEMKDGSMGDMPAGQHRGHQM